MTTLISTIARQAEAAGASPQFADAYIALHAAAAQQPAVLAVLAVLTGDVEPIQGPDRPRRSPGGWTTGAISSTATS
ncbi:MAG: hypothetical protein WA622_02950 [Mycobacterium sp.]|uniref:hypothetical protein n=1 Tax=Mycobacterium sp. TaxID=1785 RepID=UPI003BB63528